MCSELNPEDTLRKETQRDLRNDRRQHRRMRGISARDTQLARDLASLASEVTEGLPPPVYNADRMHRSPLQQMQRSRTRPTGPPGRIAPIIPTAQRKRVSPTISERKWRLPYIVEANLGWQHCRLCGRVAQHLSLDAETGLRFAHIRSWARGGGESADNITLACRPCDERMGSDDFTGELRSLQDEQEGMPPLPFLFDVMND